ncbi:MAG: hypothetical protein WC322_06670 [Candidatus Paceibacterota bacterium]
MPFRLRALLPSHRKIACSRYADGGVSDYLVWWQWGRVTWAYKMVQKEGR